MKKLMIAAAAAAMVGGAFAADDYDPDWDFAGLYNLKFTLKTLAPKQTTCSKTECTICTQEETATGNYYENGTVKLEGIIGFCSSCEALGESYSDAVLALWDPSNKEPVYFHDAWKTNVTVSALQKAAGTDVAVSNVFTMIDTTVYGKTSQKVGMDFIMDYKDVVRDGTWDLRAAGLGTWCWVDDGRTLKIVDKNLGYVKSVSGNVAGRIPWLTGYDKSTGKYWGATIVDNECGGAANYCTVLPKAGNWEYPVCKENPSVPAYGTWSMKRNDSATKKALYKSIPSYL